MAELTPYDTGARLEPHVWVREGMVNPDGHIRQAEDGEYGRVDFDDDTGGTRLTLFIERTSNGYELLIEQHTGEYLHVVGANEPPALNGPAAELDEEYRARQMLLLEAGLAEIAGAFGDHVLCVGDGDSYIPGRGNFVFSPREADGAWFGIEKEHAYADGWADYESVPVGWSWREAGLVRQPEGTTRPGLVAEGTTIPSDIDNLLARVRAWAQTVSQRAETDTPDLSHDLAAGRHRAGGHRDGPDR